MSAPSPREHPGEPRPRPKSGGETIGQVIIRRAMRGEDRDAWAAALRDPGWFSASRLLKDEPGSSWVRRATILGRDVVVKCRYLSSRSRRLKAAMGFGHGDKHWRGAALLAAKRIPTASPIALATAAVDGVRCELLVLEHLSGPTLLERMKQIRESPGSGVRAQHALARAVAEQVFAMTSRGVSNRDHKPSNLIVNGAAAVAVIDCVGVRASGGGALRAFAALVIEPLGCGVLPRRALLFRTLRTYAEREAQPDRAAPGGREADEPRSAAKVRWRELERLIARHGDPRPRTDPLVGR